MIQNNRVLVIKLSPIKGLNSSMLRALAVVKGLTNKGFIVDMLTMRTSATHVVNESEYAFLDGVNIIYANPNKAYDSLVSDTKSGIKQNAVALLRKIYHKFSIFDYTGSIAKKVSLSMLPSTEYEYIIAVSDPKTTHIASHQLIRQGLKYNKLIEYWGDPMYGDITLKSIYPGFIYKHIEKKMLSIADRIVYTSPFTLAMEQEIYPNLADRMVYSPTAYMEEKRFPPHEGKYTVGYYGAYPSNVRNLVPLYEACRQMSDIVDLKIVGNTDLSLEETDSIEIRPRGDISELEMKTDLFVCVLNKSGTQIPGKLYHYAAYNKPVLVVEDGDAEEEMHRFICSFNRYDTCKNNATDIQKAIVEIMRRNVEYEPCKTMQTESVVANILGNRSEETL